MDRQHKLSLDVVLRADTLGIFDYQLARLPFVDEIGAVLDGAFSGLFRHERVRHLVLEIGDLPKLLKPLKLNRSLGFARRVEDAANYVDFLRPVFILRSLALILNESGPGKTLCCF